MLGVEERGMRRTFLYAAVPSDDDNNADGSLRQPVRIKKARPKRPRFSFCSFPQPSGGLAQKAFRVLNEAIPARFAAEIKGPALVIGSGLRCILADLHLANGVGRHKTHLLSLSLFERVNCPGSRQASSSPTDRILHRRCQSRGSSPLPPAPPL